MGKGRKVALLVGVGSYGAGLKSLQCPANGVTALQAVLKTPEIGGFNEIIPLVDPDVGTMRARMGEVFNRLTKDDLVLFYFTGHGIKDMTGTFYLATAQTQLFENGRLNPGTAVEASFVKSLLGNCYAQRKVVVLDCCFGAAFADGFLTMDDGGVDVQADLGGEGYVVLTAATARNYALEQEGESLSVYTRYLVEGLKTGAAAPEGKEHVSARHLHDYVKGKVQTAAPTMEPSIFNGLAGQEILLARAVLNPELTYRQKVQGKVRKGRIAPAGRRFLETWQTQLNLGADRVAAIEAEVLKPFAEKQRHLDLYGDTLREEIEEECPLSPEAIQDLQDLQKLWSLRDEDVEPVIQAVLVAMDLSREELWETDTKPMIQEARRPPALPDSHAAPTAKWAMFTLQETEELAEILASLQKLARTLPANQRDDVESYLTDLQEELEKPPQKQQSKKVKGYLKGLATVLEAVLVNTGSALDKIRTTLANAADVVERTKIISEEVRSIKSNPGELKALSPSDWEVIETVSIFSDGLSQIAEACTLD